MAEVEIFLRFSEIAVETKKRDVIQVLPPWHLGLLTLTSLLSFVHPIVRGSRRVDELSDVAGCRREAPE